MNEFYNLISDGVNFTDACLAINMNPKQVTELYYNDSEFRETVDSYKVKNLILWGYIRKETESLSDEKFITALNISENCFELCTALAISFSELQKLLSINVYFYYLYNKILK